MGVNVHRDNHPSDTIHKTIAYAYASLRGQLRKTDAGEAWLKKTTVTW